MYFSTEHGYYKPLYVKIMLMDSNKHGILL